MNKNLLFVFSFAVPALVQAQTRTSVAPGNATNPFTWDCTCIPLPGNNIVINHDVILDNDFAYGSGSITINASGALTGVATNRILGVYGGSFTNHGTLTIYNMFHTGGTFVNDGNIIVTNGFAISGTAHTQNFSNFEISDSLLIDVNAMLTNTNDFGAAYIASAGTINNTGTLGTNDLWSSGIINNSTGAGIEAINLYTSGTINTSAQILIHHDLLNSENITNSNLIVVENNLLNGDSIAGTAVFTNNGTISVTHDLSNSETLNGNGSWCVGGISSNVGDVGGTLSFCDQTGDNFDNNFGTVAGTVTFCTGGACSIGVKENENNQASVYPNPVNDRLNIEMKTAGIYRLVLINTLGETIQTQNFTGTKAQLNTTGLSPGVYLYRINGNGPGSTGTLIKE